MNGSIAEKNEGRLLLQLIKNYQKELETIERAINAFYKEVG